jgi:hypothetical protein
LVAGADWGAAGRGREGGGGGGCDGRDLFRGAAIGRGQPPDSGNPGGRRIFAPKPRPILSFARLSSKTRPKTVRQHRHKPPPQGRQRTAAGEVCPILNPGDFSKSKRRCPGTAPYFLWPKDFWGNLCLLYAKTCIRRIASLSNSYD